MNTFEKIIILLQKEMPRPTSYGWFHILCLAISLFFIVCFIVTRKKSSEKRLKRVLLIYGVTSFLLELIKQVIWSYDGIVWDYQWYAFPFQFCTTPLIVAILYNFIKNDNIKEYILSYLGYFTILGGIATMIMPDSCFVETIEVNIYTMFLHCGSFVISMFILTGNYLKTSLKTFMKGFKTLLIFISLAFILNIIVYNSGILNGETFNMFYISPYFQSVLPVFSTLQEKLPYILFLITYIFAIFTGGLIVLGINKLLKRK